MEPKMEELFNEYTQVRNININKEQFIYIVNLFPALLVALSDGIVDREEWATVKKLAKILGKEFATEDLGIEKEENLSLIYKSEFKYLLKNRAMWERKFIDTLKAYFRENSSSKEFVLETMYLFANASDGISAEEDQAILELSNQLGLEA
jgi:tellurite resistance protein